MVQRSNLTFLKGLERIFLQPSIKWQCENYVTIVKGVDLVMKLENKPVPLGLIELIKANFG